MRCDDTMLFLCAVPSPKYNINRVYFSYSECYHSEKSAAAQAQGMR